MCIFCKIVSGEMSSNKVEESDDFLAFHDINPKAPIHLLVIPKKHVRDFQSADGEMIKELGLFAQKVAQKVGLQENGYRLITNIGHDGGQEVPHLHYHILGGTRLKWIDLRENVDEAKKSL